MSDTFIVRTYGDGKVLTPKQVMQVFGITESTLRSWEQRGKIQSTKVDGLKVFNISEVKVLYERDKPKRVLFPDWFYWAYEHPETGFKIDTIEKYFERFPYMEQVFRDMDSHKYATDKLSNYYFSDFWRSDNPLANHTVIFKAKEDHPCKKDGYDVLRLKFDVFFEQVSAYPAGKRDATNQCVALNYVRTEPEFIFRMLTKWGD